MGFKIKNNDDDIIIIYIYTILYNNSNNNTTIPLKHRPETPEALVQQRIYALQSNDREEKKHNSSPSKKQQFSSWNPPFFQDFSIPPVTSMAPRSRGKPAPPAPHQRRVLPTPLGRGSGPPRDGPGPRPGYTVPVKPEQTIGKQTVIFLRKIREFHRIYSWLSCLICVTLGFIDDIYNIYII